MEVALIVLGIILVGSNLFWLFTVHRLINKLMCRNYAEYLQAQKQGKARVYKVDEIDPAVEKFEKQRAAELNQIMGMV